MFLPEPLAVGAADAIDVAVGATEEVEVEVVEEVEVDEEVDEEEEEVEDWLCLCAGLYIEQVLWNLCLDTAPNLLMSLSWSLV